VIPRKGKVRLNRGRTQGNPERKKFGNHAALERTKGHLEAEVMAAQYEPENCEVTTFNY
jgi:hypothetical protein